MSSSFAIYRLCMLSTLTCALLLAGCDGSPSLPLVPVRGKITFNGGAPPASGTIAFVPITTAEGLPTRPGRAAFSTDGMFQATSFSPGDGLLPGRYGITVSCGKEPPRDDVDLQQYSFVKRGFTAPEVVVESSTNEVVVNFDVPLNQSMK
jgi:hypothetical protein